VIREATAHGNSEVTVRGMYQDTPHYEALFGDDCEASVNLRAGAAYEESEDIRRSFQRLLKQSPHAVLEVVVRGTFHEATQQECFGPGCLRYELRVAEYLCVRAAPERRSGAKGAGK
jgi:hypothetical protein